VDVAVGDLHDAASVAAAAEGATRMFLMAHAPELPTIARQLTPVARAAGVGHVVLLSSSTILTDPIVTIGRWHLAAEEEVETAGVAWTMLRPGNFASNTLRWAPMVKGPGTVFAPGGALVSAPIDPEDIAAVAACALTEPGHEGKRYVLTGEESLTPADQVAIIGRVVGKSLRFVDVPMATARANMVQAGLPPSLADAVLEVLAQPESEALRTPTVREVTGRAPRTYEEWVRAHQDAFR
jgi:uncharacterized protein YbjT (DUF2867 family)